MTTYHKRPIRTQRCRDCALPAKWIVEGGVTNYYVGDFCDEHAEEAIEQYQAAVQQMTALANSAASANECGIPHAGMRRATERYAEIAASVATQLVCMLETSEDGDEVIVPCACGHRAERHEIEPPYPCHECGCKCFSHSPSENGSVER